MLWPKPPIHKTYYRKYNTKKNNDEFLGKSPKKNEELEVQYPDHHEESPKQSLDFVTIDVVHAATTLKEPHRHVDRVNWKEVTYSAMEQTTVDFSIPQ